MAGGGFAPSSIPSARAKFLTNAAMDPNTYISTETQLAQKTGLPRRFLERVRKDHLTFGADWTLRKEGVTYTEGGYKKMADALRALSVDCKKNRAPDGDLNPTQQAGSEGPLYTLVVLGPTFNGRVCRAQIEGRTEPHRAYVKPTHRLGAMTLSAGLRLEGCTAINDELYEYHGRVPARRGLPLPNGELKSTQKPLSS